MFFDLAKELLSFESGRTKLRLTDADGEEMSDDFTYFATDELVAVDGGEEIESLAVCVLVSGDRRMEGCVLSDSHLHMCETGEVWRYEPVVTVETDGDRRLAAELMVNRAVLAAIQRHGPRLDAMDMDQQHAVNDTMFAWRESIVDRLAEGDATVSELISSFERA